MTGSLRSGLAPVTPVSSSETGGDEITVLQLINRYALAIDMHDWDALTDIFTEDAVADFASVASFLPGGSRPSGGAKSSPSCRNPSRTGNALPILSATISSTSTVIMPAAATTSTIAI